MSDINQTNINALGIVGFAISINLLTNLAKSQIIPREKVQEVFDNLLTSLETIPLDPQDPALHAARVMIEQYGGILMNHHKAP